MMTKFSLKRPLLHSFIITVFLLSGSQHAFAHKVNMFAYSEGPDVFIEGYFSDGKKALNSVVTVFDTDDTELLQGTTDNDGQFTFPIPKTTDLRIVLNAGMGHQTEYVIRASELTGEDELMITQQNEITATGETSKEPDSKTISSSHDTVSNTELNQVVERAVGQAIKPLMRSVSEMREERSLSTIVGGIGYIFGILGIVFYLKARKVRTQQPKDIQEN